MPYARYYPIKDVKVKAIKELAGVFPKYQPVIGKIYDGKYRRSPAGEGSFCIIPILDKQIVMRSGEYEIVD